MSRMSPEERRARLLTAGRSLWAGAAYDAISSREISAATGMSVGMVYHHFGNKRGFYAATIEDAVDGLIAATEPPETDDLAQVIPGVMNGFLQYVEEHDRLYVAVLRGGIGMDGEVGAIVERARAVNCQRVVERLGFEPTALQRTAIYGWVGACEAVGLEHAIHRRHDRATLVELLTQLLWKVLS